MDVRFISKGPPDQISGGYLYNRYLIDYLVRAGVGVTYHEDPLDLDDVGKADIVIVDSLVIGQTAQPLLSVPAKLVLLLHVTPMLPGSANADVLRQLYRRSRLVVTGEDTLTAIRRQMNGELIDATKIEPGIPQGWLAKTAYAEQAHALLGVANYVRGKGILRTLDALAQLRDLPWTLTLHGNQEWDTEYFAAVAAKVKRCDLGNRVDLLGPVMHAQVNQRMRESDLLVHFSRQESYSMVTAEAITCGLPVISYRTGNSEVFGRSGLVHHVDRTDGPEHAALGSLIRSRSAYGRLRPTGSWETRTWDAVGHAFLTWLEQT